MNQKNMSEHTRTEEKEKKNERNGFLFLMKLVMVLSQARESF